MTLIDKDQIRAEIERRKIVYRSSENLQDAIRYDEITELLNFIDSLPEQPDKKTILRICKLHKVWSIMAPWENVEDFVMTNWNSENIV